MIRVLSCSLHILIIEKEIKLLKYLSLLATD